MSYRTNHPSVLTPELLAGLDLNSVVSSTTIKRGLEYYRQGRVTVLLVDGPDAIMKVRGSQMLPYTVTAKAVQGGFVTFDCDCPVFDPAYPCKHIVAGVYALREYLRQNPPVQWESVLDTALNRAGDPKNKRGRTAKQLLLFFSLQRRAQRWNLYVYSLPSNRFPAEDLIPPLNPSVLDQTVRGESLSDRVTGVRTFEPERYIEISEQTAVAARMVSLMQSNPYAYYYSASSIGVDQILPFLGEALLYKGDEHNPLKMLLTVHPAPVTALLRLTETTEGLKIQPQLQIGDSEVSLTQNGVTFLSEDPYWILMDSDIYRLTDAPNAFVALAARQEIMVPASERSLFFERYLMPLAEQMPLTGDGVNLIETEKTSPQPRLYLHEDKQKGATGAIRLHLCFGYGEEEFPYSADLPSSTLHYDTATRTLRRVVRDSAAEQAAWENLSNFNLKRDVEMGWFVLRARTDPLDFLIRQIPRLAEAGYTIFGEESLTSLRVNRIPPSIKLSVSSGIDWFDLEAVVRFGEVEAALKDVRRAIRHRERYIKLADGSIGAIPDEWIQKYQFLFGLGEEKDKKLRLSRHHALLIEETLAQADSFETDSLYRERFERLRQFQKITSQELPNGLKANLYPYQKAGYDWLHFLHDYEFGGCLADDMGLGKTLMAMTFLLSLRPTGGNDHALAPDLIVVPRSLMFNWEREVQKFAPSLRVLRWEGASRTEDTSEFQNYDLVLMTYRIMLNEIERLRQFRFHYAVLDEAQAIKNPLSQTARAARLLNAEHRLTLTGTPVENATHELWSQFEFLSPGILGSWEHFRSEFGNAIEKEGNPEAAGKLRQLIQPFLLRRTKEQVAPELPPRTEELQYVEMEPAQRKIYNRLRDSYRADILGLLEEDTITGKTQMRILEALLRLRQVCCHPRLVEPDFKGDSAKFQSLLETMETLRAEGHKALVFSQFTQVLGLLRAELDAKHIPYTYLDGRTRNREERVDEFQGNSQIPFFLISLKAGGFGLNLTAADYVLHIDPWWNPAVEQQATDRAHRIGQDKPVFVYKYIARDSVEEKILELQERKKALANQLIASEAGMLKSLSRADIEALFQ